MNRCNRNMKTENKRREHQTTRASPPSAPCGSKQDIPRVTGHEIEDEDYHLSQRREAFAGTANTDKSNALALSTQKPYGGFAPLEHPSGVLIPTRKINFLKAVNSVKYLERKKIEDLEAGKSYLIEQVERITTKYGDAIIAILRGPKGPSDPVQDDDVQNTPQFKVFLPKRLLSRLSDEHMEYMNEGGIYLKFIGGKYNDLEFH